MGEPFLKRFPQGKNDILYVRRFGFGFFEEFGFAFGCGAGEFFFVGADDFFFEFAAEIGVDRVNDVAVGAVGIFAAGHDDEVFVTDADDFDVVESELIVERDGYDRLHRTFVK